MLTRIIIAPKCMSSEALVPFVAGTTNLICVNKHIYYSTVLGSAAYTGSHRVKSRCWLGWLLLEAVERAHFLSLQFPEVLAILSSSQQEHPSASGSPAVLTSAPPALLPPSQGLLASHGPSQRVQDDLPI